MSSSQNATQEVTLVDLMQTRSVKVQAYAPKDLADVVYGTARVFGKGETRAIGSNYSLSKVGDAKQILKTDELKCILHMPFPTDTREMQDLLKDGGKGWAEWKSRYLRVSSMPDGLLPAMVSCGPAGGQFLVHVEGGMKIKHLLPRLKDLGLALPTMGSGGGQSVAGALATASHGADFEQELLVDCIEALHLVDPQGRQHWITGTLSAGQTLESLQQNVKQYLGELRINPLGDAELDKKLVEIQVTADDSKLKAAAVGLGRFGVIYSIVLRVVKAYSLVEINREERTEDVLAQLKYFVHNGEWNVGSSQDLHRLSPSESQFDQAFFQRNCAALLILEEECAYPGTLSQVTKPVETGRVLEKLKLRDLSAAFPKESLKLHHRNVAINLYDTEQCWVTRRWKTAEPLPKTNLKNLDEENTLWQIGRLWERRLKAGNAADCALVRLIEPMLRIVFDDPNISGQIESKLSWGARLAVNALSSVIEWRKTTVVDVIRDWVLRRCVDRNFDPVQGVGNRYIKKAIEQQFANFVSKYSKLLPTQKGMGEGTAAAILDRIFELLQRKIMLTMDDPAWFSVLQLLYEVLNDDKVLLGFSEAGMSRQNVHALVSGLLMKSEFTPLVKAGLATEVLDTHNYAMDYVVRSNSAEFFFDASKQDFLEFVRAVLTMSRDLPPQKREFGFVGIRFMPKTKTLLGMQRWSHTVSVEVAVMKQSERLADDSLFGRVLDLAAAYASRGQAVPHWGQQFQIENLGTGSVEGLNEELLQLSIEHAMGTLYGEDYSRWRRAIRDLGIGAMKEGTFSTPFSRAFRLEP